MDAAIYLLLRTLHVILLGIAWFLLSNISLLAALFRHKPFAVWVHSALGFLAIALTVLLGIAILPTTFSSPDPVIDIHLKMGLIVLLVLAFQTVSGVVVLLCRRLCNAPNLSFATRKAHLALGYLVTVLAKVCALIEFYNSYFVVFLFLLPAEFLFWGALLFLKHSQPLYNGASALENEKKLVPIASLKGLRAAKDEYFLLRNNVYLIGGLAKTHPGGGHLIRALKGRQADKYLLGICAHEACPRLRPPVHSEDALQLLGRPVAVLSIPSPFEGDFASNEYCVRYIRIVSEEGGIYELKCRPKRSTPTKFAGYSDLSQLGRHRTVTVGAASRLYPAVNFLVQRNVMLMRDLLPEWSESIFSQLYLNGPPAESAAAEGRAEYTAHKADDVPLLVRVSASDPLTQDLLALKEGDAVTFSGYEGAGLALQDLSAGLVILVSGGCGLFHFCDLIDLLFKTYLVANFDPSSQRILADNPIIGTDCFRGFNFCLMAAFEREEDVPSLTLEQLETLSSTNWFRTVFRIKNVGVPKPKSRIARTFEDFTVAVEQLLDNPFERLYVCGNAKMNQAFYELMSRRPDIPAEKWLIL